MISGVQKQIGLVYNRAEHFKSWMKISPLQNENVLKTSKQIKCSTTYN
jgi:hypothetical protein